MSRMKKLVEFIVDDRRYYDIMRRSINPRPRRWIIKSFEMIEGTMIEFTWKLSFDRPRRMIETLAHETESPGCPSSKSGNLKGNELEPRGRPASRDDTLIT